MAKKFNIRAPKSVKLHEMKEAEIAEFVQKEAGKMLDQMPKEYRPVGVNAVSVDSIAPVEEEWGVWAQWTRACNDRRPDIEEYIEPLVNEFDPDMLVMNERIQKAPFKSELRTIRVDIKAFNRKG
jgi:5'(3')-deoxyribonucleotidase